MAIVQDVSKSDQSLDPYKVVYCVWIKRAKQRFFSAWTKLESELSFPESCPVCGQSDGLVNVPLHSSAAGPRHIRLKQKVSYCARHARTLKLLRGLLLWSAIIGCLIGFYSMTQEWIVVGNLEVSMVVWPLGLAVLTGVLCHLWIPTSRETNQKSTEPVEVLSVEKDAYLLSFHCPEFRNAFVDLNPEDVLEVCEPFEYSVSVGVDLA